MTTRIIGVLLLFFLIVMFTAAFLILSKKGKKGEVLKAEAGGT
jgi:predicted RND superfamily exporter protein